MYPRMAAALLLILLAVSFVGCVHRGDILSESHGGCASPIDMPNAPAYAIYYDRNNQVVTHNYNGHNIWLVEVIDTMTKNNRLCQAEPGGAGPCVPPRTGFCLKPFGATNMCVPC